jgi:hypothetical protein
MSLGLKEYQERKAVEEARREEAAKPKIQRFALEKDGDSATIRFGQEMDHDAKGVDPEVGIGVVHVFHNNGDDPKNGFMNAAKCSIESQGACYGDERVQDYSVDWAERKGWKQKEKFVINLVAGEPREVVEKVNGKEKKKYYTTDLPDDAKGGTVYLLEQSTYNGIYDSLAKFFLNPKASKDTILGKTFEISRKGSNFNDTSYTVIAVEDLPKSATALTEFELVDVQEVVPEVEYAQQDAFYHKGSAAPAAASSDAPAATGSATSTDESW